MDSLQSPFRAESISKTGRRRFELPMLLGGAGGLGLVACIACCTLPILGAIGLGSGAMAFFEVLEPLSAGLLALGVIAATVIVVRVRKSGCAPPTGRSISFSADGSCGCGSAVHRASGSSRDVM